MSLITEWRGEIDLPALPERKIKVGGNTVYQRLFPGHLTKARIGPSTFPNFDLVTTSLEPPYQQALLRRKANVRKSASHSCTAKALLTGVSHAGSRISTTSAVKRRRALERSTVG